MPQWPNIRTVFLLHLISNFLLVGIAIFLHVVTYPSYHIFSRSDIIAYQKHTLWRISLLVVPIMILETVTSIRMIIKVTDFSLHSLLRADFAITISSWTVMLLFALPVHLGILSSGINATSYRNLMTASWFILVMWILKAILATKMIPKFYQTYVPRLEDTT